MDLGKLYYLKSIQIGITAHDCSLKEFNVLIKTTVDIIRPIIIVNNKKSNVNFLKIIILFNLKFLNNIKNIGIIGNIK